MNLVSVIIPAKNEVQNIESTVHAIRKAFRDAQIEYDIIVVNDGSTDGTGKKIKALAEIDPAVRLIRNRPPYGFGYAIRKGLNNYKGDIVMIVMADASDDPLDMVKYVREVQAGADCCFGTRWHKEAKVDNYPKVKYFLNRWVNGWINFFFGLGYNDTTNAFKCYSKECIEGIKPIMSRHFNITVEMPLKAVVRGYNYSVVPTNWYDRTKGTSKLKLKEMGSRYLFIVIYVFLERLLCGNDYKKGQKIR